MAETTKYAVQLRNPDYMRQYGSGVEFTDKAVAIAQAEKSSEGSGLCVRVVKITRKVVWRRGSTDEGEGAP